ELVRDLHVEPPARGGRAAVASPKPKAKAAAPKERKIDPAADALPEDVVMPDRPDGGVGGSKPKRSAAAKRRSKHGRPR
ncbi:MAG: hypothetical protein QOK34_98, partial [Gaiellaceae bacterium]|nr:hypothetical protein [Gaiellaceae bacterium]